MQKIFRFLIVICLTLLLVLLVDTLLSHPMDISFAMLDDDELDFAHLEQNGENKMTLVNDGASDFDIVIDQNCDESVEESALVLQEVVYKMSGATLEIVHSTSGKGIYIDDTSALDVSQVENDGFVLQIADDKIEIKGVHYGGSRNGVYHFAEEYLGAVFVTNDDTYVPSHNSVYLEKGTYLHNPAIAGREVYYYDLFDSSYSNKLKMNIYAMPENSLIPLSAENVGNNCHSMYQYLSPEEYFDTHPEYFSLKAGKRIYQYNGVDAHLCLSNSEVYTIVENALAKKIEENPEAKVWDFSLNDNWSVKGCECADCSKMDREAGGTGMGSLLPFVNKLARKFPQVIIRTLAYFHAEKPPKNIEVEDNVVITLCAMKGDQGCSYLDPKCVNAQKFHNHVKEWSAITSNVVLWDYVINFRHQLLPFPNFAVQQANQEFYEQNNIRGVYHQGSRDKGNELCELRQYVLAKLMWMGSDMDVSKEVARYVQAYYGKAAPYVLDYLNRLHNESAKGMGTLGLYDQPYEHPYTYLSASNLQEYDKSISSALKAVEGDDKLTYRVQSVQLNVLYAQLLHFATNDNDRPAIKEQIDTICASHGVEVLHELETYEYFNQNWQFFVAREKIMFALPYVLGIFVIGVATLSVAVCKSKRAYKKVSKMAKATALVGATLTPYELKNYKFVSKLNEKARSSKKSTAFFAKLVLKAVYLTKKCATHIDVNFDEIEYYVVPNTHKKLFEHCQNGWL